MNVRLAGPTIDADSEDGWKNRLPDDESNSLYQSNFHYQADRKYPYIRPTGNSGDDDLAV